MICYTFILFQLWCHLFSKLGLHFWGGADAFMMVVLHPFALNLA
jgi:hypothetical protein